MNVYLRISSAGVANRLRHNVDIGTYGFDETKESLSILSSHSIPNSLRIQPVIPGFEDEAIEMVEQVKDTGVNHISFEYLKIATENV